MGGKGKGDGKEFRRGADVKGEERHLERVEMEKERKQRCSAAVNFYCSLH